MRIRDAHAGDATAIITYWNPQILETAVTFTTELKDPGRLGADITKRQADGQAFLVATDGQKILGHATYFPFRHGPGYAYTMEHTVVLDPTVWGRGVGRALMAAAWKSTRGGPVSIR